MDVKTVLKTLEIMGQGMGIILGVMCIFMGMIFALNRLGNKGE